MARGDGLVATISDLQAQVAQLQALGASRWSKPPTVGWGEVASGFSTSSPTGITTATDLFSVTFTAVAGRGYRFMWSVVVQQVTLAGTFNIPLTDNTPTVLRNPGATLPAGYFGTLVGVYETTLTAGSHTFRIRATTNAGTLSIVGGATNPSTLTIDDMGPA